MIISVTNQKGGVGKTTTALNISSALSLLGKNTLLIDTDPQGHSTLSCVSDPNQYDKTLYELLVGQDKRINDYIITSTIPGLKIIISRISMAKLEPTLLGQIDGHYRLKDVLAPIRRKYDFIVLDTPPTLGIITLNALVASDSIVIPIQSSYLSLEGSDDLLETIDKIKKVANPNLQILGILITLHDRRTNLGKDVVKKIRRVFGRKVFRTIISKSVKLEESPAYRESIFTYAPHSVGAHQYKQVAKEIISRAKK